MAWKSLRPGWVILSLVVIAVVGTVFYYWNLFCHTQQIVTDVRAMKGGTAANYPGPTWFVRWMTIHENPITSRWFRTELTELHVRNSQIDDAWLQRLKPYSKFRNLCLEKTGVTDAGVKSLRPMPVLLDLDLGSTQVTDAGLDALTTMPRLEVLRLGKTRITDKGLVTVAKLPTVWYLDLTGDQVTDQGIAALKMMPNLKDINLSSTALTDACIDDLAAIPTLRSILKFSPPFSAEGIERLKKLRPDVKVHGGAPARPKKTPPAQAPEAKPERPATSKP